MTCLIKKASRCVADHTSKTMFFIFYFLYNAKILPENHEYFYLLFDWFSGENCIIFTFSLQKGQQTLTD